MKKKISKMRELEFYGAFWKNVNKSQGVMWGLSFLSEWFSYTAT